MAEQSGRIVVGVDGSEASKLALQWAVRIASTTGATIEAVNVWDMAVSYGWAIAAEDWNPEADAAKVLAEAVDEVLDRPPGLRTVIRRGNAARVLLDESKGAQMLVVGSRGHGGFAGLLLGSTSANCAEHAGCPVLVVHGAPPSSGTPG